MKLLKLTLNNFQGAKEFSFAPNGENASIYGTNEAGKTTMYNAFTWLLFDKASTGEKGFSPKPKGASGSDVHNLNTRVEGVFELDDGTIITFCKDLHEKWTKKRGASAEEFTGNETDYFIDSVPVNKSEYDARLAGICPVDMVQILTQPEHFSEGLSWQNRRKTLLEVCGDVTDYDVINSSPELNQITGFLLKQRTGGQFYTVEEFQKMATAQRRDINTRLEQVPARIDEAAKAMPDVAGISEDAVNARIGELKLALDGLAEEKQSLSASDAEQSERRAIAEINTKMAEGRAKFADKKNALLSADRAHIAKFKSDLAEANHSLQWAKSLVSQTEQKLTEITARREKLATEYNGIKYATFGGETHCPTCKQSLPADQVNEARAVFNRTKSEEMERLRGQIEAECSKQIIAKFEEALLHARTMEDGGVHRVQSLESEIKAAEDKIKPTEQLAYEDTPDYAAFTAKIAAIKAGAGDGADAANEAKQALQTKIDGVQGLISAEQQKLLLLRSAETQKKRVAELEAEEKQLNKEYERLTQGLYLCEEFTKAKVRMLDEKINGKFSNVRFRLFETQINGGIKDDCEVMVPAPSGLVPFSTANNAARINSGLEIIGTLARHWGVTMPVFVDNAEGVVKLLSIPSQVIRLVVSEIDATLRVEI